MKLETKVVTVRGRKVFCSKSEEGWTMALLERGVGGPIIWDEDFDKSMEKFELGLDVCIAVSTLLAVDKMLKDGANDEEIKEEMKNRIK